jgi:branched-chain amino acid transport system ATP-binding protein
VSAAAATGPSNIGALKSGASKAGASKMGALQIQGVTKRFGGLLAVDGISFDVQPGELVGIIGPNGAGKTTLFNLLTGQLAPSAGRVLLDGQDVSRLPPDRRARAGFGRTFQISQTLVSLTTLENAMVGAFLHHRGVSAAARHARAMLDLVGLSHCAGVQAGVLTLSERRRLEVARALAMDPQVMLLDEVMAGLNPTEIQEVAALVQRLNAEGQTFLVIEHNLKVVRQFSHRVIVLDRGAMLAQGTAEQVLGDPRVIEAYVGKGRRT